MKSSDFDILKTAIITKDEKSGILVGHIPGIPGAHSQGETLDELYKNLKEVLELLEEDEVKWNP